jgi:FkbM family methyltransferase
MLTMAKFSTYARANIMELEAIIAEVFGAHLKGKAGFALFDGGAHRGYHTMRMFDLPGCERVYAVEADPFMADILRTNLKSRLEKTTPRLDIVQMALQNDPNVKTIPWKSSTSHVGRSSIASANAQRPTIWQDHKDVQYREEMKVDATTIDLILQDETLPVPFLKLDLEGADLLALLGAKHTLGTKRPIVAFENSNLSPEVHGFTLESIIAYFEKLDYVPLNFIGEPLVADNWFQFFEAWAAPREDAEWLAQTLRAAIAKRSI